MTIDDALTRLSVLLSNFQPLDFNGASRLVNHWLAPIIWLEDRLAALMTLPVVGDLASVLFVQLMVVGTVLGLVLMFVLLIGSSLIAALCQAAAPVLSQAMGLGWRDWEALGARAANSLGVLGLVLAALGVAITGVLVLRRHRGSWSGRAALLAAIALVLVPVELIANVAQASGRH